MNDETMDSHFLEAMIYIVEQGLVDQFNLCFHLKFQYCMYILPGQSCPE